MKPKEATLNNKYVYTCLIVLCSSMIAMKDNNEKYVLTIDDFRTHTITHIRNVNALGMHLYFKYKDTIFKDVPEHLIRAKLAEHDKEKVVDLNALRREGYTADKPLLDRLYENYGKPKKNMADGLLMDVAFYAHRYESNFYKRYSYLGKSKDNVARKIALIEKIADLVERERNPVSPEEFGTHKMRTASDLLMGQLEKSLAVELAKVYHFVVQPNPLVYLAASKRTAPICSALFN